MEDAPTVPQTCATCGAKVAGDVCDRCGRPRALPIDYLNTIEDLARDIVEAAVQERSFQVFSDQGEGKTPLQNAISRAARHLKYWHYAGDSCSVEMSRDPVHLQQMLLATLDEISFQVFRKNRGYDTPSPGKLIREGHAIAHTAILEVPAIGPDYLDRVLAALDVARDRQEACGISNDGWEDKNGYITSGIEDARREVEKLRAAQSV